jgi:hypothetical protein
VFGDWGSFFAAPWLARLALGAYGAVLLRADLQERVAKSGYRIVAASEGDADGMIEKAKRGFMRIKLTGRAREEPSLRSAGSRCLTRQAGDPPPSYQYRGNLVGYPRIEMRDERADREKEGHPSARPFHAGISAALCA